MGSRNGPILLIEDDLDDQEILREVLESLQVPNKLVFFDNCEAAYKYLETTSENPFLIFSDINLPGISGAQMKRMINKVDRLRRKSVPFIFLTTTSAHEAVLDAYESLAQGFFTKPNNIESLKEMIQMILSYWKICRHPNPV